MTKTQSLSLRAGIAVILLSFLAVPLAARASSTAASSPATFKPAADAYVSSSYPTTNYGTATTLRVDGSPDVHSYLSFSVSGLNGATVSAAQLRIYANSSSSAGLSASAVSDNSWSETAINYGNMPAVGAAIGTSAAVTTAAWASIDVSSYVKGEGTFSFAVLTPGATAISLASRESGANAPQLVLTIGSGAGPTPTGAPTATAAPTSGPTPTITPSPSGGPISHVFVLWMENKGYNQVWNTSSSPYITSLGNTYGRATNSYAMTHPSLPNYLDFFGGSNHGITTDCSPSSSCHINAPSLADSLEAKGLSWKFYQESMPSPCYLTTSGNYAPKHNPAIYFDDIRTNATRCNSHDVGYGALSTDLASTSTTPNFAFITPNLCDDMHSCSVSTGDTWLKNHVPSILSSPACTTDTCLLILSWDEDNGSYGNHVLTIFAGSGARTGGVTSSVKYTHYSALRTVEYIFGLAALTSNDGNASPMTDLLR